MSLIWCNLRGGGTAISTTVAYSLFVGTIRLTGSFSFQSCNCICALEQFSSTRSIHLDVFGKYVANIARTRPWSFMRCRYMGWELICDWTILKGSDGQVLIFATIHLYLLETCSYKGGYLLGSNSD
jgi:hypothetical protein